MNLPLLLRPIPLCILCCTWLTAAPPASPLRVDTWPLQSPNWHSTRGITPSASSELTPTEGLAGSGALFSKPNQFVEYPVVGASSSENLQPDYGTLRLLYRPAWTTKSGGPQNNATLAEIRFGDNRGFSLRITPKGNTVEWVEFQNSKETTLASGTVDWTENQWVYLTATYSSTDGITLYENSKSLARSGNKPQIPNRTKREFVRLRIGNDASGQHPAQGTLDEVELFQAPIPALALEAELTSALWAEAEDNPAALRLCWRATPGTTFTLRRRPAGESQWKTLASNLSGWEFTDTQITPGQRYDYLLANPKPGAPYAKRYLPAGYAIEPPADQGRTLVLVDETQRNALSEELRQLSEDLALEGWTAEIQSAPRHVDEKWSANPALIETVRSQVEAAYHQPGPPLRALYLLGHVAVPHSGFVAPDGHASRPFPVDGYYGDVERKTNDWTDNRNLRPGPTKQSGPAPIPNPPDNGIFDQHIYPSPIEIPVGRVDFANLPSFTANPPSGVKPQDETTLIKRYLAKTHRYRRGELSFLPRTTFFHPPPVLPDPEVAAQVSVRNSMAWFGDEPGLIENLDPFRAGRDRSYLLASLAGFGARNALGPSGPAKWSTPDLANPALEPHVAIFAVDGSYLGDFNLAAKPLQDVFIRALIAQENSGLVAFWQRTQTSSISFQALGLGDPIGKAWWSWLHQNDFQNGLAHFVSTIHFSLLGDPTLRFPMLRPIQQLTTRKDTAGIHLEWQPSLDPDVRYRVYRRNATTTPKTLLTPNPLLQPAFTDPSPPTTPTYEVYPTRLTRTGCGTFYNTGPGTTVAPN